MNILKVINKYVDIAWWYTDESNSKRVYPLARGINWLFDQQRSCAGTFENDDDMLNYMVMHEMTEMFIGDRFQAISGVVV
jgi:hypothetical protein